MEFKLSITCENAAFIDENSDYADDHALAAAAEVARILRYLAAEIEHDTIEVGDSYWLYDVNGNRVGKAEVTA